MDKTLKEYLEGSISEQRERLAEVEKEIVELGDRLSELKVERRGLEGNIKHEDRLLYHNCED